MSSKHPIVAVTGSSGAGTSSVTAAFERIADAQRIDPVIIQGDSFHRFKRAEMKTTMETAEAEGRNLSHFGPEANLFEELEQLFKQYSTNGTGQRRFYVHDAAEAARYKQPPGTFTPWEPISEGTDLLFYDGLHGGVVTDKVNVAIYVDLLIGVVPIVNLEWIQKIHRDKEERGYTTKEATNMILRRMHDYVQYIMPQFSRTHINFQRVPTIDTANPFAVTEIPTSAESYVVIHVKDPSKLEVDFKALVADFDGSFLSKPTTIVVPGVMMIDALQTILSPAISRMMLEKNN